MKLPAMILVTFVIGVSGCVQETAPTPQEATRTRQERNARFAELAELMADFGMHRHDDALGLLAAKHGTTIEALQELVRWHDVVTYSPTLLSLSQEEPQALADSSQTTERFARLPVVLDSISAALGIETAVAIDVLLWVELLDAAGGDTN